MRHLPNIVTVIRIMLVFPTTWFLWQGQTLQAFTLMLIASFSDALDGALARRFHWKTDLGRLLDPLADKFLVAAVFIVFTIQNLIPLWLVVLTLGRDLILLAGGTLYRVIIGYIKVQPSLISKANTAMQMLVLSMLMASQLPIGVAANYAHAAVDDFGIYLLALLSAVSGIHYIVLWANRSSKALKLKKLREERIVQDEVKSNEGGY
jgi:cardiolipin synthase|tara:strand:- start:113 stop:733 length:621 start_codon:yes stop_codon:yes gene_type:complete